jgi:hypothetical protein
VLPYIANVDVWSTPVIPALRRLKQESEASLGYTAKLCLKNKLGGYVVLICNPGYSEGRGEAILVQS